MGRIDFLQFLSVLVINTIYPWDYPTSTISQTYTVNSTQDRSTESSSLDAGYPSSGSYKIFSLSSLAVHQKEWLGTHVRDVVPSEDRLRKR